MDIFSAFATDEKKEIEGVWFDLDENSRVKVARRSNSQYQRYVSNTYERHKRLLDKKDDAAQEKSLALTIEGMAKYVLVGWEGIKFQGEPLEYSVENARKLLRVKDFRELVGTFSDDPEAYKAEKEQVGN